MTLTEFIERLSKNRAWHLDAAGCIRDQDGNCPLWAEAQGPRVDGQEVLAAASIGLCKEDAVAVVRAADGRGAAWLRKKLIKALFA